MKVKLFQWGIPFLLTLFFIAGRIFAYGSMNDSVAANDTESYFEAAAIDFPSIAFFEQMRSATLPLIIKILNPELRYEITKMSEPFFGSEPELAVQSGTEKLVQFQTILSLICWIFFTLSLCSRLTHPFSKAVLSGILYAFAFVPQIADWDSILLSESISFSLFILMMGLFILLLPVIMKKTVDYKEILLSILFTFSTVLWLFTRDTNAYFIILLSIFFAALTFFQWIRNKKLSFITLILAILLTGAFLFQQQTFRKSERWLLPFLNNMSANVFPYPGRIAFFEDRGMPVNATILSQTGSAEYNDLYQQADFIRWTKEKGLSTYSAFLVDMPLWSVFQIYSNLDLFFEENIQPFFYGASDEKPHWADSLGNLLHPLSASTILIDFLLILILCRFTFRTQDKNAMIWLIFCSFLFLGGGLLMSVSFLGEVRSIWRHVLSGVFPLRLVMWILIAVLFDQTNKISTNSSGNR